VVMSRVRGARGSPIYAHDGPIHPSHPHVLRPLRYGVDTHHGSTRAVIELSGGPTHEIASASHLAEFSSGAASEQIFHCFLRCFL
jgi:hypothetical protein